MAKKPIKAAPKAEEKVVEAAAPAPASEPKSKLVRMKRGEKFADVHPSEVDNFKGGGWKVA